MVLSEIPSSVGVWIFSGTRTFLVANLATNFQDLVAKVENVVALAPVLGAISRPVAQCSGFANKASWAPQLQHSRGPAQFLSVLVNWCKRCRYQFCSIHVDPGRALLCLSGGK